jgi:hypothetical protein
MGAARLMPPLPLPQVHLRSNAVRGDCGAAGNDAAATVPDISPSRDRRVSDDMI